jgi:hypothetical protein
VFEIETADKELKSEYIGNFCKKREVVDRQGKEWDILHLKGQGQSILFTKTKI